MIKLAEQKKIVSDLFKKFVQVYGPFFPVSKRKKKEKLIQVKEKVDFYIPRIEEKSGVKLGRVEVKDRKNLAGDVFNELWLRDYIQHGDQIITSPIFNIAHASLFLFCKSFASFRGALGAEMNYNNNSIYVSFGYMPRFVDSLESEPIDQKVVHELSHGLWDKLDEDSFAKLKDIRKNRELSEGFATYCADIYFADIYPAGINIENTNHGIYAKGRKRIEELVQKHGPEILLEIPKRWREF